ncbi:MAG: 6-pyruvoyl tetrahydrobiopterin synthase [Sphingobacteriales bacterium UTBCD1]|jgi:6-pyruvoyltetrahydropterin/6-carboxytetrahydropterin synthase|nr:MAG: 6-pyruvoyl tetrahydrobiopterin synthase [Sphingobacteriales bacterium UTBCD1]
MGKRVSVFRREHFNAAHRLYNPGWDDATNERVFDKCALPNYHGHNYELEVKVTGEVDEKTGYVMDTKALSDLVRREVHQRFDHKNLNPTTENIVIVIYELLRPFIDLKMDLHIRLYETPRNYAEYPAN